MPEHLRKELLSSLGRVRDCFIIAFLGTAAAAPQIYQQSPWVFHHFQKSLPGPGQLDQFFIGNLILMLSALLLIVLVGDLANRRAGLKPFAWPGHKAVWPMLGVGILFVVLSYYLYDHFLLGLLPEIFPDKLPLALLFPLSVSVPDELFVRFGCLSLAAWLLKRFASGRLLAVIFISAIFSLFDWYDATRFISAPLKAWEIVSLLVGVFAEHLVAGRLYIKHGFWSALAFRFGAELKYPLYFWLFIRA